MTNDLTNLITNIRIMSEEFKTINARPTSIIYRADHLTELNLTEIDLINLVNTTLKTNFMRDTLINTYLDYINNYLTISKFAEDNKLTELQSAALIALSKTVFESKVNYDE
jgi:hypothetical protein